MKFSVLSSALLIGFAPAHAQKPIAKPPPKPTPTIQKLIDHAQELPARDQTAALEKALVKARIAGDREGEGLALLDIGIAYAKGNQPAKALGYLSRSLLIERKIRDRIGELRALNAMGFIHLSAGEYQDGLNDYSRALPIWREIGGRSGEGDALGNLGLAYENLGRYQKALEYGSLALSIKRELGDREGEAGALNNIGSAYLDAGQYQSALDTYSHALTVRQQLGDRKGEAATLSNIGLVYVHLGRYKAALDNYSRGLRIEREVGNRRNEGTVLNNIGMVYGDVGQYEAALDSCSGALRIEREVRDRGGESDTLCNIGVVYARLGQYRESLANFSLALLIMRELGDRAGEGTTLRNIGTAYDHLGQYGKALAHYFLALSIEREIRDREGEAETLSSIGVAHQHLGQNQMALDFCMRALPVLHKLGARYGEGEALCNIADVYKSLGQFEKARDVYTRALPVLRETGNREFEALTLDGISTTCREFGQKRLAIAFAKQGINVIQSVRAEIRGLDRKTQSTFRDSVADRYRRLVEWLAEDGRLAEAEQVLALLKDEEYFEFIRRRAGGKAETVDLTSKEAAWVEQYDALGDRLAADVAERDGLMKIAVEVRTPEQKKRLSAIRAEADEAAKAFETFLAKAEEAFKARGAPEERLSDIRGSIDLQQTLKELPGRPAALYTLMTGDGVRVIINISGLRAPRQAKTKVSAAELNKKIFAFREALTDPKLDPRPLGAELYDLLVRPIEQDLKGARIQTLMWSLDVTLRYIPLWALYDRETKQYLIEKYPSSLFTPHTVAGLLRVPRVWTGAEFGVTRGGKVGDVTFNALPGVGEELASVHRSLGGPEPKLDDAFTLDAFRDALDTQPGVVHVATHFHFKPGDEAGSILLLGKGQSLSVEALRDMSDNALGGVDLLVLSACDTAMGGDADGKEFEGFALLAQYKGAGAVLATLWPVADESTALLMGEFYQLRKAHPEWTKLDALRQAQLEMMHGQIGGGPITVLGKRSGLANASAAKFVRPIWPDGLPKYAHPYYWAPFVLTGNWK